MKIMEAGEKYLKYMGQYPVLNFSFYKAVLEGNSHPSVRGKAVIMEFKAAKTYEEMEKKCREALEQIEERQYEAVLRHEGYRDILKYRKDCMVKQGE